jgi:hypothetical protein
MGRHVVAVDERPHDRWALMFTYSESAGEDESEVKTA